MGLFLLGACTSSPSMDAARDDAGSVTFLAMTSVSTLAQSCMPVVATDPLSVAGSVAITNTGTRPIGAVHVTGGSVLRLLGGETIATFDVTPVDFASIAPGETVHASFTKVDGSLASAAGLTGCDAVACDTAVRIALALAGPDLPTDARAASEPLTLTCSH